MGRPPSSGYCQTCRARRVKCDKGKPACQRCLRSGHACKGYEIPFQMVQMGQDGQPIFQTSAAARRGLNPVTVPVDVRPLAGATDQSIPYTAEPSLGRELGQRAFHTEMSLNYFLDRYRWAHWWKVVLYDGLQSDTNSPGYKSSQAVCLGYLASHIRDSKMKIRSAQLYSESLRQVLAMVAGPRKDVLRNLPHTVIVLGMYPYVMDNSLALEHKVGMEAILSACGPEVFQDQRMVRVFRSCRAMLVCQCFAQRQRCFLADQTWQDVPFTKTGKTSMDRLYDMFAELPALGERLFQLNPLQTGAAAEYLTLDNRIRYLIDRLRVWRDDWSLANRDAASLVTSYRPPYLDGIWSNEQDLADRLLSHEIVFRNLDQGLEILAYNAAVLYLTRLQEMMLDTRDQRRPPGSSPADMEILESYLARLGDGDRSPLLLPNEVRAPWQLAVEAALFSGYIARGVRSARLEEFVPLAPAGIIYCAVRHAPVVGYRLADVVASKLSATVLAELEAFNIW